MTKKELRKALQPGVWVELWWEDHANTIELLVTRPDWQYRGSVSLWTFDPMQGRLHSYATHEQVVRTLGMLKQPR